MNSLLNDREVTIPIVQFTHTFYKPEHILTAMPHVRPFVSRGLFTTIGALLLALSFAGPAQAQLGNASGLFLRIEPDSRSAGMGNTGVALADNANAMFWNPAGLAFQRNTQVGLTHANWLPEFNANLFYEYLVGTYHVDGVGTFGGNLTFLNLGTTEIINSSGTTLGESSSYQLALGGSYARKVSDRLSVGTNVKYIYSKLTDPVEGRIADGTASTVAFDLGGLYRTRPFSLGGMETTVSTGLNIANMGGFMEYDQDPQALPMNLRTGYAITINFDEYNTLTFANDFNKSLVKTDFEVQADGDTTLVPDPFYKSLFTSWGTARGQVKPAESGELEPAKLSLIEQFTVGTGLEYWYNDLFALRTGYFYEHPDNGGRQFLNFGAGIRYNIVGVDISYIYTLRQDSPLANTLRFSVLFEFQ